jgi:hypothetical protein
VPPVRVIAAEPFESAKHFTGVPFIAMVNVQIAPMVIVSFVEHPLAPVIVTV